MHKSSLLFVLSALASACGSDDSGVDGSKQFASLTADEAVALCEDIRDSHPQKTLTCDGETITLGYAATEDCSTAGSELPPSSCMLTVSQFRDCVDDMYTVTCATANELPASCAPILACEGARVPMKR